jgi:hypothetical protein
MATSTSSVSLWLDEVLSGWILPVVGLVVIAIVGGLSLVGMASEEATATAVVLVVGVGVGLYLARRALDAKRDVGSRALAAVAAALTLVSVLVPALATVHPGEPLFSGELQEVNETVPVPSTISGDLRLLVSGSLPQVGEPSVNFTLVGPADPIEGRLQRTFSYARVGRSGRERVAHDHTADFYPARIPPGTTAIKLDRLQGTLASPLRVSAYREPLPLPGGPWILAVVTILVASLADARLGLKNDLSVWSGMALAFGLLVTYNATPATAFGPAFGGVILGAMVGSLAGWITGALARRLVPVAKKRPSPRPNGAAAA